MKTEPKKPITAICLKDLKATLKAATDELQKLNYKLDEDPDMLIYSDAPEEIAAFFEVPIAVAKDKCSIL